MSNWVTTNHYFETHDGLKLFYKSYQPQNPKAMFFVIHGLNEHSGRYDRFVNAFANDYQIFILDLRGHGQSEGPRSYVEHFDEYVRDIELFYKNVLAHKPHKNHFLIAHSMGGQIALNFLAKHSDLDLKGFVTSSPNIQVALEVHPIKRFVGSRIANVAPKLPLPNEIDPKYISRDPEVVEQYISDPQVNKNITVQLGKSMLENQDVILGCAEKINYPALMLHAGDDHICAQEGTEKFFERLASEDKEIKIYPEMYHEIFNEYGSEEVFRDIHEWVQERF